MAVTTAVTEYAALSADVRKNLKPEARVLGALLLTAPWLPAAMIVSTAGLVVSSSARTDSRVIILGAALGLIMWLLGSTLLAPTVDAAARNTTQFHSIHRRLMEIETRLAEVKSNSTSRAEEARHAVAAAKAFLADSGSPMPWVRASGYNEVWKRLHQATQALSYVEDLDSLGVANQRVRLRLNESTIATKEKLLAELDTAFAKDGSGPESQKRAAVYNASKAIDEYRDGRWDEIIARTEDLRFYTAAVAGLAYLGFVLVIAQGIPAAAVFAATAYMIVGGLVGLITRGDARAEATAMIEDFGLDRARTGFAVVLSAVVAVLSVGVIAFLATASITTLIQPPFAELQTTPVPTPTSGPVTTPVPAATPPTSALDIGTPYDLARYPGGLLIAAIFGLSPRLLLGTLSAQAERLKTQLQSTEASEAKK